MATDLTVSIHSSAETIFTLLGSIDTNVEPTLTQTANGLIITFSNGVKLDLGVVIAGNIVSIGAISATGPGNVPLLTIPNIGLTLDLTASNIDPFASVDNLIVAFSDAADNLDIGAIFGLAGANSGLLDLIGGLPSSLPAGTNFIFDMGGGRDVLTFAESRSAVNVQELPDGLSVTTSFGAATLRNVEEIVTSDGALLFDQDGPYSDYTYALYAAALTRTPDKAGFVFWNTTTNSGAFNEPTALGTELALAQEFVDAAEFTTNFDVSTNQAFVTALYNNVLQRNPDAGGLSFWVDGFSTGLLSQAQMLREFSISAENQMRIAPDIENGYWVV